MRVLVLLFALAVPLAQAQTSGAMNAATPEAAPLTQSDVRELIRLRFIEIDVLEAAEAELGPLDNDENAPVARERVTERLALEGWDYADYQTLGERVANAMAGIVLEDEMAEINAEIEASLAGMAAMLSAEQLEQARAGMATQNAEAQELIDATRPDWPAVRAYLGTFGEIDAYMSGDRATLPLLPGGGG